MAYPLLHPDRGGTIPGWLADEDFTTEFPGESNYVEFKQGISEEKIKEATTAFSNADGGVILCGVGPTGSVVGMTVTGELHARLHRVVSGVRNPGRYEIFELIVGQTTLIVIAVGRRREGFAQMMDGRVLVRRGAMNQALFDQDLTRFIGARALTRFETAEQQVRLADADQALVDNMRMVYGWGATDTTERLREIGLVGIGPEPDLTVAGVLYLTIEPERVLGKAFVEIFRYRDGAATYDRRLQIVGPLDRQVTLTTRALMDELGSDLVVLGTRRHDLPRIPEPVLREAVANALAHRIYENARQPVRIDVRPDHVSIQSPGGLPEPVTVKNMRAQTAARNLNVIRVLRQFGLAEDAGRGVDVMEDTMEANLLDRPAFDDDGTAVRVTLPLGSAVTPRERAWIAEVEERGEIQSSDRILLVHSARGEVLTNGAARDLLGVDSVHARTALQRLRDLGYLTQSGRRGGASYTVARTLAPPAGLRLDQRGLRDLVLELASDEPVTNGLVRERTGLDRAQVLGALSAMVESGELVRRGERRGSYYVLPEQDA